MLLFFVYLKLQRISMRNQSQCYKITQIFSIYTIIAPEMCHEVTPMKVFDTFTLSPLPSDTLKTGRENKSVQWKTSASPASTALVPTVI